jgi:hypothetical protein
VIKPARDADIEKGFEHAIRPKPVRGDIRRLNFLAAKTSGYTMTVPFPPIGF